MDASSSQPPTKRPRIDSNAEAPRPPSECTRSPTLWFDDGSIVLQAEGVRFKVYKGILAANSVIFRDMFAMAQATDRELVEGCTVVHLGDKAEELTFVLEALHDSRRQVSLSHRSYLSQD